MGKLINNFIKLSFAECPLLADSGLSEREGSDTFSQIEWRKILITSYKILLRK